YLRRRGLSLFRPDEIRRGRRRATHALACGSALRMARQVGSCRRDRFGRDRDDHLWNRAAGQPVRRQTRNRRRRGEAKQETAATRSRRGKTIAAEEAAGLIAVASSSQSLREPLSLTCTGVNEPGIFLDAASPSATMQAKHTAA